MAGDRDDATRSLPTGGPAVAVRRAGFRARAAAIAPAVLIGVGLAGTLDEVVFHQLLRWHHFDDRGDLDRGLISDGLFHLASTAVLVLGVAWAVSATTRAAFAVREGREAAVHGRGRLLAAGILIGAGAFNLYDGTVQHKVFRLHQVRPAADNWLPYDLAWNAAATALLVLGVLLLVARRSAPATPSSPRPAEPPLVRRDAPAP